MTEILAENAQRAAKQPKLYFNFDQLGLSKSVTSALKKIDFEVPTEIQAKAIPPILKQKDVVGMARTGSGKTAAYIAPIISKLQMRDPEKPFRAICLSPTREIAIQVHQFCTKIAMKSSLKISCIIGGTSLNDCYQKMHSKPDILIATPGRLAELINQMELKFNCLEMLAIDEADKMFEAGFETHLKIIIKHITSAAYQKMLFSATLPRSIMNFINSDLKNPHFVEIDEGNKLSDNLGMINLLVREDNREESLIFLVNYFKNFKMSILIFMPTRHDVCYFSEMLFALGIRNSIIFSTLEQEARDKSINDIKSGRANILLATDLAARGIDIPDLDIVLNYNFPNSPKLFMHRVGRVCRMQNRGLNINLLDRQEMPLLMSVLRFLKFEFSLEPSAHEKNSFEFIKNSRSNLSKADIKKSFLKLSSTGYLARLDDKYLETTKLNKAQKLATPEMATLRQKMINATEKVEKFNPNVDPKSLSACKQIFSLDFDVKIHEIFLNDSALEQSNVALQNLLQGIKQYKCKQTILEKSSSEKSKKSATDMRSKFSATIKEALANKAKLKRQQKEHSTANKTTSILINYGNRNPAQLKNDDIQDQLEIVDNASKSLFSRNSDDPLLKKTVKKGKVWDRYAKKFISVQEESKEDIFKPTEKSQSYKHWLKKANSARTKQVMREVNGDDGNKEFKKGQGNKNELKTAKQIAIEREKKDKQNKKFKSKGSNKGDFKKKSKKQDSKKPGKKVMKSKNKKR